MLLLNLKFGEYLTIGEDTYIQFFKHSTSSFRAAIHAPRDVTILRGDVYERTGERPEGLHDKPPKSPSERRYDARHYKEWVKKMELREQERRQKAEEKAAVLHELTKLATHMDELIVAHGNTGVQEKLIHLCSQLESFEAAQDENTRGGGKKHELTGI